jgi:hypothetical protein
MAWIYEFKCREVFDDTENGEIKGDGLGDRLPGMEFRFEQETLCKRAGSGDRIETVGRAGWLLRDFLNASCCFIKDACMSA